MISWMACGPRAAMGCGASFYVFLPPTAQCVHEHALFIGLMCGNAVTHIVLLKLKPDVKESQLDAMYEGIQGFAKIRAVDSVSAGGTLWHMCVCHACAEVHRLRPAAENFSSRADGFSFAFVLVLNDLKAYMEDPLHLAFKEQFGPLLASEPVVLDYEYPRSTAKHKLGREIATPELQRWDPRHTNEDLEVQHTIITAKNEASVWRTAVTARPVRDRGYVDFVIE